MRTGSLTIAAAAALVVAAGVVPARAQAAAGCRVTYEVTSQWQGGFGATADVTNLGDALTGWQLTWSFPAGQTVTQLWNGTVAQSGPRVTVTNAGWNGNLGAGGTVSVGFNGSWSGGNPAPTDFALNGVPCNGGGTTPTTPPATDVLGQVSTVSRVRAADAAVQYTWPGTYFEGRFRGTSVGLILNDATNDYTVQVDGATVATIVTPGRTTYWIRNLADGDHTVRLAKRTEGQWAAGEFGGLVGTVLGKPALRSRQIEFIGDSWTAGYGNMSTSRDCTSTGGLTRNSNADVSFGALTARGLNADYQINAWSGLGMVRNYNGQGTDNFRTYYETDLQAVFNSQVWPVPSSWRPQVVVVGLGINDFSTALNAGEKWASVDQLAADYRAAYGAFLDKLRARYGANTFLVLTYPDLSYQTTALADAIRTIVQGRNDAGDARVSALFYDNTALGLDLLGCDWHPSQRDHRILADAVTRHLAGLPLGW
ncbi:cellulose binding domain-containing protein [Actinoplanes sp. LDG1-06]|uniref:Cellulose binding domain-containing protein n=1 Tax=Paractinoplanes ovalisporus TaxID=2810368 RepID=A0ABS2AFJ9_9ACTN|nr:cellulose binding domain-containing protein [Actinoplanes ovalisporus]MBM2618596.1 cellulose binding domain-containing protein [Actinoplanes ovalisporus]